MVKRASDKTDGEGINYPFDLPNHPRQIKVIERTKREFGDKAAEMIEAFLDDNPDVAY